MVKKVITVQDLSGLGRCSLTAVIPVLSVMGVQACPLPTAVLTAQTGFPSYYIDDYTDKIDIYISEWKKLEMEFDGIFTGFLAGEAQVDKVLEVVDAFDRPDTLLVVDPVMGDGGKIYSTYTPKMCEKMKKLVVRADVITPNLTEACILLCEDYEKVTALQGKELQSAIYSLCERLCKMGPKTAIITGVEESGCLWNFAVSGGERCAVRGVRHGGSYSGTGDLFAAVICGGLVGGEPLGEVLQKATDFIECATQASVAAGLDRNHGVDFEQFLNMLM